MARPSIAVAISFTANASDVPTWQDVSSSVRSFSIRRGRSHESEAFPAGQGSVVLDDPTRAFDPTNTSSAWYPYVLTLRRLRIQATWAATTYDLFYAYILSYQVNYPDEPAECTVTLQLADAFTMLALAKLNTTFAQQTTAARFTSVLDAISWPAADRSLHTAQQSVQPATLVDVSALSHLQATIASENGALWVSKANAVTTVNRDSRNKQPLTSTLTWGDGGGAEELYKSLTYIIPGDRIINSATVTLAGGASEVQSVTISGNPTGGTFTLTWNGHTTAAIDWNATAATVQTALEALGSIQPGNVAVSGGPGPQLPWYVTYQGALAGIDVAALTSTSSLTGGSSPAIAIATSTYYAVQQSASDATSQAQYYIRSTSVSGSPAISLSNAARVAGYLVGRYKDPLPWYVMEIDPNVGDTSHASIQWVQVLTRDLNDRLTVAKTNVPGGAAISVVCHIDSIAINWTADGGEWDIAWGLTPADTLSYWQLDDATYGVLDSTTRLRY